MQHTAIVAPHLVPLQRTVITLRHHLDVNLATQYLLRALDCDEWDVRCRHDHQVVVRLTRGSGPAYHVSYECSPAVENAICHGHRAWALTLTPVAGEDNLSPGKVAELKAGLAGLQG